MIEKDLSYFCGKSNKYMWKSLRLSAYKLVASIAFSYLFARLLESILRGRVGISLSFVLGGLLVILLVKQYCLRAVAKNQGLLVSEVKEKLREAIYEKLLLLGISYQEAFESQEIIHLSVDGVEQLENYFGGYLMQFYYCFISSILLFSVIAPWNLKVALILLVLSLSIPLTLQGMLQIVKRVQRRYWSKYMTVGKLFLDSLQGLTTLKIYGSDQRREEEIAELSEGFRQQTMRVLKMQLSSIAFINWIVYGGTVAAMITAMKAYQAGNLSLFGLLFLFFLAPEFFLPMRSLTALFHVAMTGVAAGEEMLAFLRREEGGDFGREVYQKGKNIEVKHLHYGYTEEKEILKDLSLSIEAHKMTAIVGSSGCGKSTLAALLSGEQRVGRGQIFLGEQDFCDLKKGELAKNVLRITHEGHIFAGTLRENLKMGNPKASEEDLWRVLEEVSLKEVFEERGGLDFVLLSQGKNLSGGQAQRLSLARALLHEADLYIFDEASSNVDVESEEIILEVIHALAKKKTVLYISHRLASIVEADCIYVMEAGRLIQEGRHEELYAKEGRYRDLFKEQEDLEDFRKGGEDEDK